MRLRVENADRYLQTAQAPGVLHPIRPAIVVRALDFYGSVVVHNVDQILVAPSESLAGATRVNYVVSAFVC
jgi:hypothetical protein